MSSPNHEVLITPAEDADLDALVQRLAAKGLTHGVALRDAGIITGRAAPHALDALRAEPGVAHVEPGGEVQLPPPDSDIQ